jgi:hypothetical protein
MSSIKFQAYIDSNHILEFMGQLVIEFHHGFGQIMFYLVFVLEVNVPKPKQPRQAAN